MISSRICSLSRLKPRQFVINPLIHRKSSFAPSYSSTGDIKKSITKLQNERIASMIIYGKPNRPFPEEYGLDVESMTEGAKQAIGVVSEFLEEEEYDKLGGLVSPECIAGLKKNLAGLTQEEKRYLRINPEDIFFSFIPVFRSNEAGQTVTLVTFSLPGLLGIKERIKEMRIKMNETMEELKKESQEGKLKVGEITETLKASDKVLKEMDPYKTFQENEILIGNYKFEREDKMADWTLVEITQVNSVAAWAWIFRKRWKGRLGISLRGPDFYSVLRYDYMTDFVVYLLMLNLITAQYLGIFAMGSGGGPPTP
ncbi:uncharacterized protein LOC111707029 [Eurytemora carolleeae]|uniref:uncharacterized protein LOC111707029 n=1 Tax=Eurytemora carolleeae TaxID=1294199 RepID=UPI000C756AC2|nr:uncharacterized protein LOC111707029 [Eurytemora carolleeae]|eukprot:XP_023335781.1 uncharacterized protein LOC111707029 [Eurytemora affinis]